MRCNVALRTGRTTLRDKPGVIPPFEAGVPSYRWASAVPLTAWLAMNCVRGGSPNTMILLSGIGLAFDRGDGDLQHGSENEGREPPSSGLFDAAQTAAANVGMPTLPGSAENGGYRRCADRPR